MKMMTVTDSFLAGARATERVRQRAKKQDQLSFPCSHDCTVLPIQLPKTAKAAKTAALLSLAGKQLRAKPEAAAAAALLKNSEYSEGKESS